jgi:aromatic-amino-acid transaminase
VVCTNSDSTERVLSQLKIVIRANYSSPLLHGALLDYTILNGEALTACWKEELTAVLHPIPAMNHKLVEELVAIKLGYMPEVSKTLSKAPKLLSSQQ